MTDEVKRIDSKGNRESERLKIVLFFCAASVLTAPVYVYSYGKLGSPMASLAVLVSIPFLLSAVLIWRLTRSSVMAGNWIVAVGYLLFLAISFFTGGIHSLSLTWALCIPIVATLVGGWKSGSIWLLFVVLELTVFYFLDEKMFFRQEFTGSSFKTAYYLTILGAVFITFFLAVISEYFKNKYLREIEESNRSLEKALSNVKTLKGLLPICAWCKKIRDDRGYWDQIETYFSAHTNAEFSHGICPTCEKKQTDEWQRNRER